MKTIIVILFFLCTVSATVNVSVVSETRADLINDSEFYLRVTAIERCFVWTCFNIYNYTVDENVITFAFNLKLDRKGNLTVNYNNFSPNGLFVNSSFATTEIVPPPVPPPPASPLWYVLWCSLFASSFVFAFFIVSLNFRA